MDTAIELQPDPVAERVATKVREALALTDHASGIEGAVDAARLAMIEADTVSLFGTETDHPDHGNVRWIVGQSGESERDYVVLALTAAGEEGGHRLHAASAQDLSDAFLKLAPTLAHVEAVAA